MTAALELDRLTFKRVAPLARDGISAKASQFWDVITPEGHAVAQAEVFTSPEQWGVRLFDRMPQVDTSDLVRLVARLLVWHALCPTETVELVIMRRGVEKQTMVRVAGDYV
ncbi:MAG: hypothetical protein J0L92_16505 [Deltaproteobacteria bacterium]|nr:hypothetical protein [Deltaproteobacteria bacterium]